ncbi:MAG: FMN-binding glutamate synthase family protein [Flavobacteriales bacterium]|nr:FMN-binding glutamate synthase family protein [Flavobacteriales bacterium]
MNARKAFAVIAIVITAVIGFVYTIWPPVLWSAILFGPLILVGITDIIQSKHTIRKNFPVLGHGRYMLEKIRPEIMQYFVESDTAGKPFNRLARSLVYQRAKNVNDTVPFGTQVDVYRVGYEWLDHSIYPKVVAHGAELPRVLVGGPDCTQPYNASLLNISAMSYGALSKNAIMALNKGAKIDGFAHNTGEGGISPFHIKHGGDLIWQIGTGYFGCRAKDGKFNTDTFAEKATIDNVKMIEIKISQGAKPGHGGILPASKNTLEIAAIRDVEPNIDIISPPSHSAFSSATELMDFIKLLREKSGGKPIGFKLCVGKKQEFKDICEAMIKTGIKPDFITVDGGEGGTGAAPIEFSDSLGAPLPHGLSFVYDTLVGYDLKKDIKIISAGKIINGFQIVRNISLGADMVNSARAMMLAMGCIQALQCNNNTCPTGVATQNEYLIKGLDVDDKAQRVANYHHATLHSFMELIAATGISQPEELERKHINRRISMNTIQRYDEIFPYTEIKSLLKKELV